MCKDMHLKAMVLVFEERLGHSIYMAWDGLRDAETGEDVSCTEKEMIEYLKQGVRDGEYVGYMLHYVKEEVIGNVDTEDSNL